MSGQPILFRVEPDALPPPLQPRLLEEYLRIFREYDPRYRIFGSEKHRHTLNRVLSQGEVEAFEQRHALHLPADYRAYITTVANGGSGPHYGLYPLASNEGIGQLFPLTESHDEEDLPEDSDWSEPPGTVLLCDEGSGIEHRLIVSGPAFGSVWAFFHGVYLLAPSFDEWFRLWAERTLARLMRDPLAQRLCPGMALDEVERLTNTPWRIDYAKPALNEQHRHPLEPLYWLATTDDLAVTLNVTADRIVWGVTPHKI